MGSPLQNGPGLLDGTDVWYATSQPFGLLVIPESDTAARLLQYGGISQQTGLVTIFNVLR